MKLYGGEKICELINEGNWLLQQLSDNNNVLQALSYLGVMNLLHLGQYFQLWIMDQIFYIFAVTWWYLQSYLDLSWERSLKWLLQAVWRVVYTLLRSQCLVMLAGQCWAAQVVEWELLAWIRRTFWRFDQLTDKSSGSWQLIYASGSSNQTNSFKVKQCCIFCYKSM